MANIFQTLFGTTPAAASQNPAPSAPTGVANPGQPLPGTQASQQTAPNGTVPSQSQTMNPDPTQNQTPASPLEAFKDIWQTPPTDPNSTANQSMFANLDPAKLMESAKRVDFAKAVTPEILQKIQAGGPEASAALMEAMNTVAQMGYAQSALATTKIVEQALAKAQEQQNAQLPTLVKKLSTTEATLANNPLLQNPAVRPMFEALQSQLLMKNPNASSAEIQQQVGDFFSALGSTFAPAAPQTAQQKAARTEEDWSKFLS